LYDCHIRSLQTVPWRDSAQRRQEEPQQ
jgi:hypothetical protein